MIVGILCSACNGGDPQGENTRTFLNNNSGRTIELQPFSNGKFGASVIIKNAGSKEYIETGSLGSIGFRLPFFLLDSIRIFYYEEASIWHTKAENQVVSKSLLLESSYQGGKVKDGLYEFTYTFTVDDFQEAVDFGD